ncbi:hypothetical protein CF319_g9348 [Tilletia indica]|nr:hypothetical protein CF319_g9348 [Tilletia indica]
MKCGGTKVRLLRRRLQPVRQDYGSYGSGATRRILTSRGPEDTSSIGSRPAGPRGRHSPTPKVRRGGETTAGDLTAAKA